jgi:type I restriction enzyme S subunit
MAVRKGYKQTEVGVIPEDWETYSLRDLVSYVKGYPFSANDYKSDGVRVLRVSDTTYDRIKSDGVFIESLKAKQFRKWELREGDLVVSTVGSKPPMYDSMVGKATYISKYHAGILLNQNAVVLRSKKVCLQRILHNHFRQPRYLSHIECIFRGNANQASITLVELFQYAIPLPPTLAEQEAIAGALSDADAWIESLEQLIAKKRQIKQGAMQELLTGKRRLPGFSGKWETKRLGDLGTFFSGGTPNTSIPEYFGGDILWITSGDCNAGCIRSVAGRLTPAGVANSATKWIEPKTVLMALYGATAGVVAISEIHATINQAVLAMKLEYQEPLFIYQKLSMMKEWIIKTYTQGGQPNLSGAIVKSIELDLPAVKEQSAIATVLSDMDTEIDALESKLAKAREIKKGMMQELLTGRIRLIEN